MKKLTIKTEQKKQVIDITDQVQKLIEKDDGLINLFVLHTTAALTTADLDPGTDLDMLDAFEAMMPKFNYRHPHNPQHVTDHILSSIIGPSVSVPVGKRKLVLGTWQRIVLVELDGPRQREVLINFF
jgi:secondary thiamine-phosphate synthase enzyme